MESKIFERSNRSGGSAGSGFGEQIAKLLLARRRGPHGDLITVLSFGGTRLIIQWRQKGRNASSAPIHIYRIHIYLQQCYIYTHSKFELSAAWEYGYRILFFLWSTHPPHHPHCHHPHREFADAGKYTNLIHCCCCSSRAITRPPVNQISGAN